MRIFCLAGLFLASAVSITRADWIAGRDLIANEAVAASEALNPNPTVPAWSYGYRSTLSGTGFTPFTTAQHHNSYGGSVGLDGFSGPINNTPLVFVNTSAVPIVRAGMLNLLPGEMELHPGPNGERAIVRWKAPITGVFSISAAWQDINSSNGDGATGAIVVKGSAVFSQAWANGGAGVSKIIPSINLTLGDEVDFLVEAGGNYFSDSTRFNVTITDLCKSSWKQLVLRNTGVDDAGVTLADGTTDTHWTASNNANGLGPNTYVSTYTYFAPSTVSKWIGVNTSSTGGSAYYTQSVDLTGLDPNTATITGRWACDNDGEIYLNGNLVVGSATVSTTGFKQWKAFNITGFQANVNTLQFRVHDIGGITGLRVEMSGRAYQCCPQDRVTGNLPLKNTGVDGAGVALPLNAMDPFYRTTTSADPALPGPNTYIIQPNGSWLANTALSKWISLGTNPTALTGNYVYAQQFNLTYYDASTASITGRWACDNSGSVWLNGVQVSGSATVAGSGFAQWQTFTINSGFNPGLNTLEFRVYNNPSSFSQYTDTGVRVEMTGTAMRCFARRFYYEDWIRDYTTDSVKIASLAIGSEDTDGDGQINAMEYAAGTDPVVSNPPPQDFYRLCPTPGQFYRNRYCWTIIVRRPIDVGAIFQGECSTDLRNWKTCERVSSEIQPDGLMVEDIFEDTEATNAPTPPNIHYMRARVDYVGHVTLIK